VNLSDLVIVVRASTKDFEAGMARTKKEIMSTQTTAQRMNNVGGAMAGVGKKMALGITLPVVAGAAIAVKMAASMETTMNQVQAASGATGKEMKSLGDYALKMGADTMFSAGEAAQAMLELSKGGMSAATIKAGGLKAALDLAAAGDLDLATAAETTVKAMGMFGLGADQASSIAAALAGGANASTASVESLSLALAQVGPGATNAGLTLQDTVGVLASFANKGIMGSDAGTSLKTMLTRLVPTTDKAAKTMKALGLNFVDSKGNIDDITTVAQKLHDKLGPLSQAQRTAALSAIFGSDATRAATVLMGEGAEGIQKYIDAASDQNAAQDMAKARTKGLAGQLEQLKGSLETIAIIVGQILIPPLTSLTKWLTGIANKFMGLDKGTQKAIITFLGIAAVVGPLLILFGKMAQGMAAVINVAKTFGKMPGGFKKFGEDVRKVLSKLDLKGGGGGLTAKLKSTLETALSNVKTLGPKAWGGFKKALQTGATKAASGLKVGMSAVVGFAGSAATMVKDTAATVANTAARAAHAVATGLQTAAQWALNAAMAVSPIIWIIIGIVALVAIFIVLWKRCEWFRNFWKALWKGVVAVASAVWKAIKPGIEAIWKGIKVVWDKVWAAAKWVWARIGPMVVAYVKMLWTGLKFWFGVISKVLHRAWTVILAVTKRVWPLVLAYVRGVMTNVRIAIAVVKVCVGIVRAVWNAIKAVTSAVWKVIAFVVRQAINRVVTAVHIVQKVVAVVRKAWNKVHDITTAIWNGLKKVIGGVISWIWDQITGVFDKLKGVYNKVKGWLGGGAGATGGKGRTGRGRFASGGYIPATRGGRNITVAEGGEGEWVVPASKAKDFASALKGKGDGGTSVTVNIGTVYGTDRNTAEKLARMTSDALMRGVMRQMVGQNG